jgi:hypothetical protein
LDLLSFNIPLLSHLINLLLVFLLNNLIDSEGLHLLLNFKFVLLLQRNDLSGTLLGLFNFLPRTHLLLLKQSDTVGEQLCVTFNAIKFGE